GKDLYVSKTVEEKSDDAKTDDLSEKMRLVQAKRSSRLLGSLSQIAPDARKKNELIHKRNWCRCGAAAAPHPTKGTILMNGVFNEQRVEHDSFSQSHAQHRQRDDFSERAGITPNGLGCFHATGSDSERSTEATQA